MCGRTCGWIVIAVWLAACGRFDFDPISDATLPHCELRLDRVPPTAPISDVVIPVTLAGRVDPALLTQPVHFDASNGDELPSELESSGVWWVQIPAIADTSVVITAVFGTGASGAPVWTSHYEGVYHLANDATDASPHHRDGVTVQTTPVVGRVAGALAFDAAAESYVAASGADNVAFDAFTISGWMWMNTPPQPGGYYATVTREANNDGDDNFYVGYEVNGGDFLDFDAFTSANNSLKPMSALPTGTWMHLGMTYDGVQLIGYFDGVAVGSVAVTGIVSATGGPIYIGADRNNIGGTTPPGVADYDFVDGMIDEVRIESAARDPAWIAYDDAAQRDQVITYGPVVTP